MALRLHIFIIILFFSQFLVFSQETREDIEKRANSYFSNEMYIEATPLFLHLISLEPRNANYNYKYGTCLLFNSQEKQHAFKYLNYAVNFGQNIDAEAYYFLGKAYHLTYQFDKAIENYTAYKQKAGSRAVAKLQVDRQIEMCRNGKLLMADISETIVLKKTKIDKNSFFRIYDLKDIGGEILVTEEFQTRQDRRNNHVPIIHFPSNSNKIYYSSYGEGDNKDIYERTRLPNRTWSKAQPVFGNVNTDFNEDFPYMSPNRRYLYFCSEGHNSMGGYDIFRSVYDKETNQFGEPENLDIPISSPDNDFLYIVDSLEQYAYFSSQRTSEGDKVDVYQVRVQRIPLQFVIIKGSFSSVLNPNEKALSLTLKNNSGESVGNFTTSPQGDYLINLPSGGRYEFILNVADKEQNISHFVDVPYLREFRPLKQVVIETEVDEKEVVEIHNLFDERFDDEEAIIAEALALRARMNVNSGDFDLDSLDKIAEQRKILNEIGLSNYSNAEIHDLILGKFNDLTLRQNKTEILIKELTEQLVYENKILDQTLKQADSLMNVAVKSNHQLEKEKNILLAFQSLKEAEKKQDEIIKNNNTLLFLSENYVEKQNALQEANQLKEAIQNLELSDDEALLSVLNKHKKFGKNELNQKTRQDALFEYQEIQSKQTQEIQVLNNKKTNVEEEIQRTSNRLEQLRLDFENASRRQQQSLESEITREEIALEDLNREKDYLQQQLLQAHPTNDASKALASLIEKTNSVNVNIDQIKTESLKNSALIEQKQQLESTHSKLVEQHQIDVTKSPSEIQFENDGDEELAENHSSSFHQEGNDQEGNQNFINDTKIDEEAISETIEKTNAQEEEVEIEAENMEEYFIEQERKEIEERATKQFTKEEIEKLAKSFTIEEIRLGNLKLENHFSEINHEYILSQNQHTKPIDLIQAEIKQIELEKLIHRLENETNVYQYGELQEEIQIKQNELIEQIENQKIQIEIKHYIEDEIIHQNYDFVTHENSIETEESIRAEQLIIQGKIQELQKKIEENEILLTSLEGDEKEATQKQTRQFKIVLENLTFKYDSNEKKLQEIEENKTNLKLNKDEIVNVSNREQNKIVQTDTYKKASLAYQEIKHKKEDLELQEKLLKENKEELQRKIEKYTEDQQFSALEKEEIVQAISRIDNAMQHINRIKNEIIQLNDEIKTIISHENQTTKENILTLLEQDIESLFEQDESIADAKPTNEKDPITIKNDAQSSDEQPATSPQPESTFALARTEQMENIKDAEERLNALIEKENQNPQLTSKKSHQNKMNVARQDVITQKEEVLKETLASIEEDYSSTSGEIVLPTEILIAQHSTIEVERLTAQANKEKNPARKQDILTQIEEVQNRSTQQIEAHLHQQKQEEIIEQALQEFQLDKLSIPEIKENDLSLKQENDAIALQILEIEDDIKAMEIELQQARKRDQEELQQTLTKLENIKADFIAQQGNNQIKILEIENQRRIDNNKGVAENAINTKLSYEEEVEMAQSELYKAVFKDINQLHQKQDEIKVKTELLDDTKKEIEQLTAMETSSSSPLVTAEEMKVPLQRMNQLSGEIEVLREEITDLQNKVQTQLSTQTEDKAIVENLIARDVAPIKEPITLKTMETGIFLTGKQGSYSDENPIPIEENKVGGLIFRVQIGAFSRPVPNNTFAEFHPISGEPVRPGLIRYVAGLFNNRNTAEQARDQIRALGYSDAFVVAYCDGERIPVYRAVELMKTGACVPEIEVETDQLFVQANEAPSAEGFTNKKGELDVFAYNQGPNAAKAEAAEAKMGLYYTVQVGVYNRPVSSEQLFHISPLVTKRLPNGQIRYSTGIFNTVEEARPKRSEAIEKGVSDAFITAYYQGNRISLQEAEALLTTQGETVLELNNPTVKRGNEIVNKPTSIQEEKQNPFLQGKETQHIFISKDNYKEYPTQVLNRLNEKELQFYYDSITQTINSLLFSSNPSISTNLTSNFDLVDVYNNVYRVLDKSATDKNTAVENPTSKKIHLSIEVDVRDMNSDLLDVIYNAPFFKEVTITEQGLTVDFYTLKNREKEIDFLKALLAKLGATFHAKYD